MNNNNDVEMQTLGESTSQLNKTYNLNYKQKKIKRNIYNIFIYLAIISSILIILTIGIQIIVIYHFSLQTNELMKVLTILFNIKNNTLYLDNNNFLDDNIQLNNTIQQFQSNNNTLPQFEIDNNNSI